jgi:tetratricopeptide (TPR) repeat protein
MIPVVRSWALISALLLLLPSMAAAAPWSVRGGSLERAALLLSRLEGQPRDAAGLRTLVSSVGRARALALARRSARKGSWAASFIVGRLELAAKRRRVAVKAFRRALKGSKGKSFGSEVLGWAAGELVAAGHVPEAKRLLDRWLAKRPKDVGALRIAVRIALSARDQKKACTLQGKLAALLPSDARVWLVHARLLRRTGQLSKAARGFEAALKLVHKDPALRCQLLRELGSLLDTLEQFDAAILRYKEALKLTKKGGYVHRELQATILASYRRRGALVKLVAEAQAMLKEDPKNQLALLTLAQQMAQKPRRMHEAIKLYERYLALVKNDIKARATVMFLLLRLGRAADAVKHAAKLHALQPEVPRRLLEYAGLLAQLRRKKEAIAALERGIALYRKRKSGDALHLVALALHRLNAHKSAGAAFRAMLALDGKGRGHRYHRIYGHYLWRRAERVEALKIWGAGLGPKAKPLAYARWTETMETVQAWRYPQVRPLLRKQLARALKRFPRNKALAALRARLAAPSR